MKDHLAYEYERWKRKAINDIKAVNDAERKEGDRNVQVSS